MKLEQATIIFFLTGILLIVLVYLVYKVYKDAIEVKENNERVYIIKNDSIQRVQQVRGDHMLNDNVNDRFPTRLSKTSNNDVHYMTGGVQNDRINIRTRNGTSSPPEYRHIGNLYNTKDDEILALYSRPRYYGSNQFYYYALDNGYVSNRLTIKVENKECDSSSYGCEELQDGISKVYIVEKDKYYDVKIFKDNQYRYNPFI